MRLRLRIERNELPAVSVLWTIGDTELKQTVAQFVERVDERFPLEGESWGLEQYAVTVGGFEALHYSEVGTCFQNEDSVVIKPLQFVDLRARTITGRDQITEDGRHLLDGVPFGRPLLKRPRRPEVHIPPRKRQRLEELESAGDGDAGQSALVRYGEFELDEDEDDEDEDDADFDMEGEEDEDGEDSAEDEDGVQQEPPRARRSTKSVKFADANPTLSNGTTSAEAPQDVSSSDESSDDSSDEDKTKDSSSDSSDSDSDDSSDSSSDGSNRGVWNGIASSNTASPTKPQSNGNGSLSSVQPGTTNGTHAETPKLSIPHEGKEDTKMRNARRREQRQLKHLKESGMVSAGATLGDMRELLSKKGLGRSPSLKAAFRQGTESPQTIAAQREKLLSDLAAGGIELKDPAHAPEEDRDEPPEEEPITASKSLLQSQTTSGAVLDDPHADKKHATPNGADRDEWSAFEATLSQARKRLDVSGINRMVFGSLGVRTPKTQADKDALQKKLAARAQRTLPAKQPEAAVQAAEEGEEDADSWQDKIEITAVECCDEGVTLSAPPFPFQQRWDPQYQIKKRRGPILSKSQRKKRKTQGNAGQYMETYDKYNKDGGGDALNYDDPVEDDEDEYWEDGALLDDEGEDDIEVVDDGFPEVPLDISTLPDLAKADAAKNDYIVYKELSCTAATNWEPKLITRTARLDSQEGEGWKVTFAQRDLQPKQYDDEGNRIYSKFEMADASEDEGEEETPILDWATFLEPKLLQRTSE